MFERMFLFGQASDSGLRRAVELVARETMA
jgi:hypothetical protein